MPQDWVVVVADVVDSTRAIREGQYKQVNVLGAAIITSVRTLFYPGDIPYVFAGDGVFLCIPPVKMEQVRKILSHIKLLAKEQFGLIQVSGIVPVTDIRAAGSQIRVARYYISEHYQQAVFEGGGLATAEELLRDPEMGEKYQVEGRIHPETDISNLECRWNHLESVQDEIICVLVKVVDESDREEIYRRVVSAINRIYCQDFVCKPVREEDLNLTFDWDKLSVEYKIRSFGMSFLSKWLYFFWIYFVQIAGTFLMYFGLTADGADWGAYKKDLEKNTDYRKFDDMVREVLTGSVENRKRLESFLENLYQEGKIAYGIHVTPTVMITCMVMDYDQEHIHLVDGSAGGYAAAAAGLKERLKKLKNL